MAEEKTDHTDEDLKVFAERVNKISELVYELDPRLHKPSDQVIVDMVKCLASAMGGLLAPLVDDIDDEGLNAVFDMIEMEVAHSAKIVLDTARSLIASGQISGASN